MLGYEVLTVVGDVSYDPDPTIRTVTLEPTLEHVTALGVLVVVRTFLAWSIVVELQGRWPWQLGRSERLRSLAPQGEQPESE